MSEAPIMAADHPKVSIIIPVFNGANFLREAIESALSQTYRPLEVIVVNDGSSDDGVTEQIALSFGERIRYFYKENGGVATALNLGINHMTGHYFSWLSHDDLYTPNKIELQVDAARRYGREAVVYGHCEFITPSGETVRTSLIPAKAENNIRCLLALGGDAVLHGCSLLIPREFFERFGRFNPQLRYTQDYECWFRMAGSVPFIPVREVVVRSRQHPDQDSRKFVKAQALEVDRLFSRFLYELSSRQLSDYHDGSIAKLISQAQTFLRNFAYEKTSCRLLKHLCVLAEEQDRWSEVAPLLDKLLVGHDNSLQALETWRTSLRPLVLEQKSKPRVLVYARQDDKALHQLTALAASLEDYEWIVVADRRPDTASGQEPSLLLPLALAPDERLSLRLSALASLLDADLFIGAANDEPELLPAYEKLSELGVRTVACDFEHYFHPYELPQSVRLLRLRTDAYSKAGAVVWTVSDSARLYARLHGNGALLPALPDLAAAAAGEPGLKASERTGVALPKADADAWQLLLTTILAGADQPRLNEALAAQFAAPEIDLADFTRQTARAYEHYLAKLLSADVETKESLTIEDTLRKNAAVYKRRMRRLLGWSGKFALLLFKRGPVYTMKRTAEIIRYQLESRRRQWKTRQWAVKRQTEESHVPVSAAPEQPDIRLTCEQASSPEQLLAAAKLLDPLIFHSGETQGVAALLRDTLQPLMRGPRSRPLLGFHIYGWGYGGAERLVALLTSELARRGYDVALFMFEPFRECDYEIDPAVRIIRLHGYGNQMDRLQQLLEWLRPDVFVGNNNIVGDLAELYGRLRPLGIKTIAYSMENFYYPHHHDYYYTWAISRSARIAQADVACFLTHFSAQSYGLLQPNAAVLHPMRTFDVAVGDADKPRDSKRLLAVGRYYDPVKRLDRLLRVFKLVLDRHPDARLTIVGPVDMAAHIPAEAPLPIGELLKRMAIPSSQLEMVGLNPQPQTFYAQADLFLLTSDTEGFPMVLAEAASHGLPMVVSDIPGLEDIVKENETGHIVPQDDLAGMAAKVADLLDHPGQLRRMSRHALETARQFTAEQTSGRWERMLRLLLADMTVEERNRRLAEEYMEPVQDAALFARRTIQAYEQSAIAIARWKQ